MKRYTLIMFMCFFAIISYADEERMGLNIGLKGGSFFIGYENSLNIFSLGGTVGYISPFKSKYFELAFEGDFNLGCFGGDYVSGTPGNKSRIRTFGAYAVINTIPSNEIYFKGKIGITHETVFETIEDIVTPYREIGPSFGIGVGYNASDNVNVEGEFTTTNSDMKFFSVCFKIFL